jgi:hypothetical protein
MRAVLILISLSLIAWSLSAQAVELMVHSSEALMGRDQQEGLAFSAVVRDDEVVLVEIHRPETHYLARIDYARETLALKSLAPETGAAAPITSADIAAFTRVLRSLTLDRSRVAEALISTLTWLADHPPNVVVDLQTRRLPKKHLAPQAYTSLCASIGQAVLAQYTIDGEVQEELAMLGACAGNECLGRCGTGCASNLGNPAEVQRYTQECLNHDACNRATNAWDPLGLYPPCSDEFAAAVEGYFFAPDCPDC